MTLQIIFPATDEGALSTMLRGVTKAIEDKRHGGPDGYGLGGAYGYGADWDSPVFTMRRFCWCELETCPWCEPEAARPEHGAIEGHWGAPQFWHKPSGVRVWWYKYIGRSMEVHGDGDLAQIGAECLADIASAIEAASADETRSGSAEGESAAHEVGDAQ